MSSPSWAKKLYPVEIRKSFEREYHWIFRHNGEVIAFVTFDLSPAEISNKEIMADLLWDFSETIVDIHKLELLRSRIAALQHCLRISDRPIAVVAIDGSIIAATNQAHAIFGRLVYGEGFSAYAVQEVSRLPALLENSILSKKSQVKLSPNSTATIKPWEDTGVSTLSPRFEIEIFTEAVAADKPLPLTKLSFSERRVLELLVTGRTNKEIAREKRCSVATVRHQIASVYDKLGMRRREEVIAAYYTTTRNSQVAPLVLTDEAKASVSKISVLAPRYFAGKASSKTG